MSPRTDRPAAITADEARSELVRLAELDLTVRSALAASGELFAGYHPRMAAVHRDNAERLRAILAALGGWPTTARVGAEASEAAWLVVQHAIGEPEFQRAILPVLEQAAAAGEIPPWQPASLDDRVRAFEGRPQRFGTQVDWDDNGHLVPSPVVDAPDTVDARRAAVGLPPLAESLAAHARRAERNGERPPADRTARQREFEEWARAVGWRSER